MKDELLEKLIDRFYETPIPRNLDRIKIEIEQLENSGVDTTHYRELYNDIRSAFKLRDYRKGLR